jgi:hypothetical protein
MSIWKLWIEIVTDLRPAFSRERTFLWFMISLAGFCCRIDLVGVTSFVRALGLKDSCYMNLRCMFHSTAIDLEKLAVLWLKAIIKFHPSIEKMNGRYLLVADGIKKQKSGKKMPAVKLLHQDSESNTKAEYIMGHSCQSIGILARSFQTVFCIPVITQIHEGIVESNRDKRTLMDRLITMVNSLKLEIPFYLIADAYYGNRKIICGLIKTGQHLICRARSNSVAFERPAEATQKKAGRPRKFGRKVLLRDLWIEKPELITEVNSPIYGEQNVMLKVITIDLLVKYCNSLVRFVLVDHPNRGKVILFSTDTSLDASSIIKAYGLRFKIEVSFKQAVWTIGTFTYRFWMKDMKPTKRKKGDQHIHMEPEKYREAIKRKMRAYQTYLQVGVIAQGLLQMISSIETVNVWDHFGSWIRTRRVDVAPSEKIVSVSMRNGLPEFLASTHLRCSFRKFLRNKIDLSRSEGALLAS